ncbi:MAG TPA: hypothetical protein VFH48_34250 [Chloroflexota bacterium]|nr:hypothetical protein [Chloroflexota bacterium]
MFVNRIRTAALALAGVALIATSLMSSVALAAPAESQPSPARTETVAAQPKVDIPRADGSIILSKIELVGMPKYTFTVANSGPERASFKILVDAAYRECNGCDLKSDRIEETVTLSANSSKEYQVACKATMITLCQSVFGEVKVVGVDPYPNNNMLYIAH